LRPSTTRFGIRQEAAVGESEYFDLEDSEGAGDVMASLGADGLEEEVGLGEYEGLGELEFEEGFEGELGEEFGELEGDEFLGSIWNKVKKVAKVVAPIAKKFAPIAGKIVGGALGGPAGAMIGSKLGGFVSQLEAEEFDGEGETEDEMQATDVPGLLPVNEALAEEFAAEAAEAESESEAQGLAGGITIHILSRAPMSVQRVSPVLVRRTAHLARVLRKNPQTKPFMKTLPTIAKRTVATLSKKAAKGKPITPRTAVRTMAKHTVRVMGNPKRAATAIVKNSLHRRRLRRSTVARVERV
jgi:hypothetical protein